MIGVMIIENFILHKENEMGKPNNQAAKGPSLTATGTSPLGILIQALQFENREAVEDFVGSWQRKKGEPLFSPRNIIKAFGVVAGYAVYRHIDPWPNSKADNIVVSGAAVILLALLVMPRSATGKSLLVEKIALEKMKTELTADERKQVIEYLSSLSAEQKKRVLDLLRRTDQGIDLEMLKEEDMRRILLEFVGEDDEVEMRKEIEEIIAEMKKFWAHVWPGIKEGLKTADHAVAEKLRGFRGFLNEHGIKRYKYLQHAKNEKDDEKASSEPREKIVRTILFLKINNRNLQELLALIEEQRKENNHV